jgi:hypothetical protein
MSLSSHLATPSRAESHTLFVKENPMAHLMDFGPSQRLKTHADQQASCRRIVQATTLLLLPVVLVKRLTGFGTPRTLSGQRLSIFAEARADASAIIPYIFMG